MTDTNQKPAGNSLPALAIALALLTVIAYLPVFHAGFVFDDYTLITRNPMIKASNGLYRFWCTTEPTDYYPLTSSLWWLEWRLWGANPIGYHAVNVLLHAANAILVWIILKRLRVPGAWVAGLVFAIHPVNVATVAWISEQKNTLSMLLYATALLLYLQFDEEHRWSWYGLSLAAFLLALLSKTAVVMLPVVLLGCVWWLHRTVRARDILYAVPFFVLSLVMGLVNIWFQYHRAMAGLPVRAVGFPSRLAAAGCVPWFYLCKALLPANLMMIYPKWDIDASRWISFVPGIVLLGCLALFWWKRNTWGRPLLFGLGYFVVTLFPVLGFFDQNFFRYTLVADHWQYYSIVGVIALAVAAGDWICRRMGEQGRHFRTVLCTAVLIVLGTATWTRSRVYASDETLWRDNVARSPNAWPAHNNLAYALSQSGKLDEAVGQYEQALRFNPDYPEAQHNNLGVALAQLGRIQEAIGHYEQALHINPNYADAHNNLATALYQTGQREAAIEHYQQALRFNPDYVDAHNNLGLALIRAGRMPEAIDHLEHALRINPDYAEAHFNLGIALEKVGRTPEAVEHYQQALRIKPDFAQAQNALARLQSRQ